MQEEQVIRRRIKKAKNVKKTKKEDSKVNEIYKIEVINKHASLLA